MKIKMVVNTGWANGDHVDYIDLPIHWDSLSEEEKEEWLHDCAVEHLNNCCDTCAYLVEDDE